MYSKFTLFYLISFKLYTLWAPKCGSLTGWEPTDETGSTLNGLVGREGRQDSSTLDGCCFLNKIMKSNQTQMLRNNWPHLDQSRSWSLPDELSDEEVYSSAQPHPSSLDQSPAGNTCLVRGCMWSSKNKLEHWIRILFANIDIAVPNWSEKIKK